MPRKRTCKALRTLALFATISLVLSSFGQMSSAGQGLGHSSARSATAQASTPAQSLQHPLLRAAGRAQRIPVSRWPGRAFFGDPIDPDQLVFLVLRSEFYWFDGGPVSVAVKDVNGDGKPDLVVFGNLFNYEEGRQNRRIPGQWRRNLPAGSELQVGWVWSGVRSG